MSGTSTCNGVACDLSKSMSMSMSIFKKFNPFNTTQYVKRDGFQVLLDRHVMYAIGTASDFELMK